MTEYRILSVGTKIEAGDEFQRNDETWVTLKESDIISWLRSTGKPLLVRQSNLPVRRLVRTSKFTGSLSIYKNYHCCD